MRADIVLIPVGDRTYRVEEPKLKDGLRATVAVLDAAGATGHADRLNLDRERERVRFASTAGVPASDLLVVRDRLLDDLFGQPADEATEASPLDEADTRAAIKVLEDPALLEEIAAMINKIGYVGDPALPLLICLAITSRLLTRPLNLVIAGPSSAGKSFVVGCVCDLFPPESYYLLHGMSDRALIYTDADLRHRTLIIGEAAALAREGIGAALLRSIAWEGEVVYEVVEKTADGMKPRRIEKPGPTGFITTTTGRVEPELETRTLTLTVPDTEFATRTILSATAARANGHRPTQPDLAPWRVAQRWLAERGDREVTIPYAERLGALFPARQVRARRDFTQLVTLLQAHALLYQRQRARDEHGRIVASADDYRAVHALAAPVFGAIAAEGVTPAVRETVAAVAGLLTPGSDPVSLPRLAAALNLDKSAASRRVARCVSNGWLVNEETRKGRPAALKVGDPLPDAVAALPEPEEVFRGDA